MAGVELTKAYVTLIPSFQGAEKSISDGLTSALGNGSAGAGKAAGDGVVGGILSAVGAKLPGGIGSAVSGAGSAAGTGILSSLGAALGPAAVAAAVAGIGVALYDLGSTWDEAFDTVRAGTGATGDDLAGLEQSLRNVTATVPNEVGDVADAFAELNTRTGATGETLERLTSQFIGLENLGYSADIDKATGMMNAWGVATDDMSTKMDELFVVSQSTGVSIDSISSAMSTNAASMQELGFSFEQTAAMAGQFDKAGLDASGMMSKMSKACISLAQDGEQPAEAYQRMVGQMRDFIAAGDEASAMNLATDLFGTKGAAQFVQALETGAMDIDAMTASLENADGAIAANEKANRSAAESMAILKNKLSALLEPLGSSVFGSAADAVSFLCDAFDQAAPAVDELTEKFMSNEDVQNALATASAAVGGGMEAVGSVVSTVSGLFMDATSALGMSGDGMDRVASIAAGAFSAALGAVSTVVGGVTAAIRTAGDVINWFKSLFSGELRFPRIVLPHIRIDDMGELPWGIGGMGRAPQIGIDWYARGGVMTEATAFNVSVGGEAGKEAIMPLEGSYMQPFAQATAQYMGMDELISEVRALRKQLDSVGMYVDGKKMVGALISEIDSQSNKRDARRGRWVAV